MQWLQLYEIDAALVSSVLNGLTPAFSDYAAWLTNFADLVIIASPQRKLGEPDFSPLLQGSLKTELERLGLASQEQIAFRKVADSRVLRGLARLHDTKRVNSDYLPILGLEAPKTRFARAQATDLLDLSHMGPPLLEALGVRKPLNLVMPSAVSHFPPETASRQARALAAHLRGDPTDELMKGLGSATLTASVLLKNSASAVCRGSTANERQRQEFATGLRQMADNTITFLPPSMLNGVLIEPRWLSCNDLPVGFNAALELLASLSKRDYGEMQRQAQKWLDAPPEDVVLRREFDQVALSNLLLSLAHQGLWSELSAAEIKYGVKVNSQGPYLRQRQLLLAMASE